MSPAPGFSALRCAATMRELSVRYAAMAREYPNYAEADREEARKLKKSARFWITFAKHSAAPRLP